MEHTADEVEVTWYTGPRFRRTALAVIGVAIVVQGCYAVFRRDGDLLCHINYGNHFLQREPYANPGNYYPLGRVMVDVVFTLGGYHLTRAVFYGLAIGALIWCFRIWEQIASASDGQHNPASRARMFAASMLTLVVLVPFIIRDLDECGLQIFLLLMCSLAVAAFQRGRLASTGFWLAAAATYKATPLLFLPFLLWKRQWKAAGCMALFIVAFNLLPATYLGWEKTLAAHQYWFTHMQSIAGDTPEAHPSVPGIELPKHQNVGLSAAFARLVETYPPGHPLFIDHPLFFQFGNLSPERAKLAVKVLIVLLGAALAWQMRRPYTAGDTDIAIAANWAVTCIFCAILSPLCWRQHLVLLIPAVLLLARSLLLGKVQSKQRLIVLAGISAAFFLTHRTVFGKELTIVLLSYHCLTFAAVAMAFLVLTMPAHRRAAAGEKSPALPDQPLKQAA
ncbi:MAG: glycosyltransferase family 87 protein [Planctomycetaceae bacterium]